MNEQQEEQASLYVLGMLEPEELRAFETQLATNEELRHYVDEVSATAAVLAHTAPSRPLPPDLEGRILTQIREGRAPAVASSYAWLPWAIAACLTVAFGLLFSDRTRLASKLADSEEQSAAAQSRIVAVTEERDQARQKVAQLEDRESTARTQLAKLTKDRDELKKDLAQLEKRDPLSEVQVATLTSKFLDAPNARATVIWDGESQRGVLKAAEMPANRSDQDYQLWIVDPDRKDPIDGGVFHVDDEGTTRIAFKPKARVTSANAFAVSLERKGGVPKAEGPMVLVGK